MDAGVYYWDACGTVNNMASSTSSPIIITIPSAGAGVYTFLLRFDAYYSSVCATYNFFQTTRW